MKIKLKRNKKRISKRFEELLSYNSCLINNNQSIILPGVLKKISFFNPEFIVRGNEIELSFRYNINKYNINFLKNFKKNLFFYKLFYFLKNNKIIIKNFNYNENTYKEITYNKIKLKDITYYKDFNYNKVKMRLNYRNKNETINDLNLLKKLNYSSLMEIENYNKAIKDFEQDEKVYKTNIP